MKVPKLGMFGAMAKNTSITLGDHYEQFVADMVASGRYATSSEVIRAGLRMVEDYERKVEAIRGEIEKGERSGVIEDFSFDGFLAEMKRKNEVSA